MGAIVGYRMLDEVIRSRIFDLVIIEVRFPEASLNVPAPDRRARDRFFISGSGLLVDQWLLHIRLFGDNIQRAPS